MRFHFLSGRRFRTAMAKAICAAVVRVLPIVEFKYSLTVHRECRLFLLALRTVYTTPRKITVFCHRRHQ